MSITPSHIPHHMIEPSAPHVHRSCQEIRSPAFSSGGIVDHLPSSQPRRAPHHSLKLLLGHRLLWEQRTFFIVLRVIVSDPHRGIGHRIGITSLLSVSTWFTTSTAAIVKGLRCGRSFRGGEGDMPMAVKTRVILERSVATVRDGTRTAEEGPRTN